MSLHHMLRAAAGYQAPAPANTDPQFNYVSLLLHGDGTNGAQNNTFLDSSSNNFTITRNGNTTQGSLSPYGNLWSNFFSSTTGYLTVAGGMPSGTGTAFTMECWIYITNMTDYNAITRGDISPRLDWGVNTSGALVLDSVTVGNICASASNTIQANVWYHVVVTRSTGNVYKLWVNGTNVATSSAFGTSMLANTTIGYSSYSSSHYFKGYISNFRVVTSEVYTSAFTPPTAPLTAISGTSLLTCQSNRFRDASANNFTITVAGDVRVTKEAPFLPTAAYSTSVIGGSGYFDGSGDSLSVPSNAAFSFGTDDFTIEFWMYVTSYGSANQNIIDFRGSAGFPQNNPSIYIENAGGSGTRQLRFWNGATDAAATSGAVSLNTWIHVAASRSSNSFRCFVNGTQVGSTTTLTSNFSNTDGVLIAAYTGNVANFFGYLSNVRVVKGTAVYTSAFTPPTAPLTAITNTSLLLNFTNAGIFDNAAENDLETVGNAQISTSVKKYGTGSMAFDGTGDCVVVPANPNINITSGDFTIEFWAYPTTQTNSVDSVFGYGYWTTMFYRNGSTWTWEVGNGSSSNYFTLSGTCTANTWQHIALTRSGNTYTFWLNGVAASTTTNSNGPATASRTLAIGLNAHNASPASPQFFTGYVDDFRLTKGYARYTSTFTPPTAAFPDQ